MNADDLRARMHEIVMDAPPPKTWRETRRLLVPLAIDFVLTYYLFRKHLAQQRRRAGTSK